ncbi:N-6 DNA methylase [Patescibacteria group bacterium]|nr:N-6 DNA methylase [Patescibacteria group bacterium]MBU1954297.1 N-6 DNA methylase [Patescibacteria group bacterium]
MAKLFKDKTIRKNLEKFDIPNFEEKLGIVNKWLEAYKNKTLHQKTESQCEQAFNQSFFVELLGYTTFPNTSYTIEPKATTDASGQKPDAALGYYEADKSRTIAVVEVKDVNTALDRSQKREGNLSPVQQAFKYKPQFKECIFVIASNFYEIRLHKDNQLDYELFTLESLADPKDDYFQLRKFYYLLCADNFISKAGKTKTEALLSDIRIDQEKITKKFYQEYKLLRQLLIKDIVQHNSVPKSELLLIIEKAQKIIDRIVFVCFCEDTDLLPEDTLQTVIKHAESSFSNQWDILKGFFNAIDSGSEKLEIPHGYNGGLFAEDPKLNSLKISDEVCKQFLELGKYDFSEDLSVNILGHIFEQSVSDIEEIKSRTLEGEEADKKSSKRKKEGIFYTPDYIVDYIVKNSLGKYLEEKETEIKEKNNLKEDINDVNYRKRALATYIEYQTVLRNVKVLDPACGSGAFLVKVFDYLLAENIRVANIIADLNDDKTDLFSSENYIKSLLENNIFGVDLNPESVEITKLSLWLKSAQKDKRLVNLKNNIKCGNSLIDDPAVAGERAFKWENEFKEIMDGGGFDVVVGNPPYVLCQPSNTNEAALSFYKDNFEVASYKIDLFHLFVEKAIKLLATNGFFSFITPNTYLTNKYILKLRNYILENCSIKQMILFDDDVFDDASVDTSIIVAQKNIQIGNKLEILQMDKQGQVAILNTIEQANWNEDEEKTFNIHANIKSDLNNCIELGAMGTITFGLQTKDKSKYVAANKADNEWEHCYTGKDITRYHLERSSLYFKNNPAEVKAGGSWDMKKHHAKKIVVRQVGNPEPLFAYDEFGYASLNTMYNIIVTSKSFNPKYLLAILNSTFIKSFWLNNYSDNKKTFPKIKGHQLAHLPIPNTPMDQQLPLANKAEQMLELNRQLHEKIQKFLRLIHSEFKIEKTTRKLGKFYELDFDEFTGDLGVKKLGLEKKGELLEFFEKHKQELLELKAQIDTTDKEIDDMVFNLYGLTEDEPYKNSL